MSACPPAGAAVEYASVRPRTMRMSTFDLTVISSAGAALAAAGAHYEYVHKLLVTAFRKGVLVCVRTPHLHISYRLTE